MASQGVVELAVVGMSEGVSEVVSEGDCIVGMSAVSAEECHSECRH